MKEYIDGLITGIIIGITALELCEENLPRNKYCKLIGVK